MSSDTPDSTASDDIASKSSWHADESKLAFYSLILSGASMLLTFGLGVFIYIVEEQDEKFDRSVTEVNRVFDKKFIEALTSVLEPAYKFYENPENLNLSKRDRYERFWYDADVDAEMLFITARLGSIASCLKRDQCYPEEIYSRFPEQVLMALYFLREFVWPDHEVWEGDGDEPDGWAFGSDDYKLLAGMCDYVLSKYGDFGLWSVHHEKLRAPGEPLPHTCFETIEFDG